MKGLPAAGVVVPVLPGADEVVVPVPVLLVEVGGAEAEPGLNEDDQQQAFSSKTKSNLQTL